MFQDYCESIKAYLVEIESLEENNWIHANLVYQHFRWDICKTMLIIRIEIHVSIWRGGNLLAYLKLNSVNNTDL